VPSHLSPAVSMILRHTNQKKNTLGEGEGGLATFRFMRAVQKAATLAIGSFCLVPPVLQEIRRRRRCFLGSPETRLQSDCMESTVPIPVEHQEQKSNSCLPAAGDVYQSIWWYNGPGLSLVHAALPPPNDILGGSAGQSRWQNTGCYHKDCRIEYASLPAYGGMYSRVTDQACQALVCDLAPVIWPFSIIP
jgi:hypothetical protein